MKHPYLYALFLCSAVTAYGMGKDDKEAAAQGPTYIALHSDQGIYNGAITDGTEETRATKISFAGETTLDSVRKERDNSSNRIKLAELETLEMLNPAHESARYKGQDYCLMRATMSTGAQEELLFPRKLIICAQSATSKIEKSWYIESITRIDMHHRTAESHTKTAHPQPADQEMDDVALSATQLLKEMLNPEHG